MTIDTLPFERRPRNTMANNLDKINELIDYINHSTITPAWNLDASATGESVTVGNASSLKGLQVHGKSVQDGTPTPDAPVPVQVVGGRNILPLTAQTVTSRGVTATVDATGTVTLTGTATDGNAALTLNLATDIPLANNTDYTAQRITISGTLDGTFYIRGVDDDNQTVHHLFNLAAVETRTASFTNNAVAMAVYIVIPDGTSVDCVLHTQLERGSTATGYMPYGCIALDIDGTQTPIGLQGNTLASLPDGTRDELHVDSAGRVWVEKRVEKFTLDGSTYSATSLSNGAFFFNLPAAGLVYGGSVVAPILCDRMESASRNGISAATENGVALSGAGTSGFMRVEGQTFNSTTEVNTWLTSNPTTLIYPLATPQTIDLGYIAPPAIPSGSTVTISASLTPEFQLEWWVESGITTLVNDLIAYVDYKTEG